MIDFWMTDKLDCVRVEWAFLIGFTHLFKNSKQLLADNLEIPLNFAYSFIIWKLKISYLKSKLNYIY